MRTASSRRVLEPYGGRWHRHPDPYFACQLKIAPEQAKSEPRPAKQTLGPLRSKKIGNGPKQNASAERRKVRTLALLRETQTPEQKRLEPKIRSIFGHQCPKMAKKRCRFQDSSAQSRTKKPDLAPQKHR